MKRRPITDQAKLLFLYLLRSSAAALATENSAGANFEWATGGGGRSSSSSSTASSSTTTLYEPSEVLAYFEEKNHQQQQQEHQQQTLKRKPPPQHEGYINLRLARRTDVQSIQSCNLATLPENYNQQFYINHLRTWPELSIVAEHIQPPSDSLLSNSFAHTFYNNNNNNNIMKPKTKIVAYVLGRANEEKEELYNEHQGGYYYSNSDMNSDESTELVESLRQQHQQQQKSNTYILGHVTSLAVRDDYRRNGLASELMKSLHLHLQENYNAKLIGLHVRKSNVAATKLYEKEGYVVANVISDYYQDGEDAYYMTKDLSKALKLAMRRQQQQQQQLQEDDDNNNKVGGWVGRMSSSFIPEQLRQSRFLQQQQNKPWETGPIEYRLPRTVVQFDNNNKNSGEQLKQAQNNIDDDDRTILLDDDEEEEHVMTGTF